MSILNGLNEEQKAAASIINGPVLILAGAGSGKTRTITYRIAHMILEKGIQPSSILAVTFTNKAAKEMKERVAYLAGDEGARVLISTFHSFGVRMLRMYCEKVGLMSNFNIYDAGDQRSVVSKIMKSMKLEAKEASKVVSKISKLKEEGMTPDEYSGFAYSVQEKSFVEIYRKYNEEIKKNNAIDFSDILLLTDKLFQNREILEKIQERFKYIMIDEYQDTNKIQYEIIKKLAAKTRNLCVVGDEDQSIYRFRGADIRNILDFEKDYKEAKIVKLERNYRSTHVIVESASSVISKNISSKGKKLWTEIKDDSKIKVYEAYDAGAEAEFVVNEIQRIKEQGKNYKDFTILYRTNAQSRLFEDSFRKMAIPYKIYGSIEFYQRKEIKDIMAYLSVINNPNDSFSLTRVINTPARGIGDTTVEKIEKFRENMNVSFFYAIKNSQIIEELPSAMKVKVKTVADMIDGWIEQSEFTTVSDIVKDILEKTNYIEKLDENEKEERGRNLQELVNGIIEKESETGFISLADYLEEMSLVSGTDNLENIDDAVKLMTIHSSKGLEFPVVFIAGLEEELFPSGKANVDTEELEEERRLAYVAITRAERHLYLTYARQRTTYGTTSFYRIRSRFIDEIPAKNIEIINSNGEKIDETIKKEKNINAISSSSPSFLFTKKKGIVEEDDYKAGDIVVHKAYGKGKIIGVEKIKSTKDDGDKIKISFFESGEKSFRRGILEKFLQN